MAKNEGGKGNESEQVDKVPEEVDQTTRTGNALTGLSPEDRKRQMSAGYDHPEDEDDTEKK